MQQSKRILTAAAITMLLASVAGIAAATAADTSASEPPVTATWEHHHANFTYIGITALYSCDGLETNIRSLLLYLGARKDATVRARGCPRGSSVPERTAILDLDFYSLSPRTDAQGGNGVQARWVPVQVRPRQPSFVGNGDCELIDELRDILSKNFSLRELSYRTDCVPHQVNVNDFGIKADALKPLPPGPASAAQGYGG
jgi:hypothetical protein